MARKTRLTKELIQEIVERIKVGTYPYIAAAACGIPRSTFYDWMQRGESGRKPYSELLAKVREASSLARSNAEVRVFRDKPFEWLRFGPGREREGEPGWTESPTTLKLEGGLRVETAIDEEIKAERRQSLGEMLLTMQELGYIAITEMGKATLLAKPMAEEEGPPEETALLLAPSGNGSSVDGQV